MHFDRVYSACKYDFPKGMSKKSAAASLRRGAAIQRITPKTDVRTFRCGDYLGWETGLLPFSTTPGESDARPGAADGSPSQRTLL